MILSAQEFVASISLEGKTFDAPVPSKENETQIESAEYLTEKETLCLQVEKLKAEVKKLKYKQ